MFYINRFFINFCCFFIWNKNRRKEFRKKYSQLKKRFRFYGQCKPEIDRVIFERYFKDKMIKGVCLETGAYDGLSHSNCRFFEESLGWECYNIEAHPELYKLLVKNRKKSKNFRFALSSENDSEVKFFAVENKNADGLSGVAKDEKAFKKHLETHERKNSDFKVIKAPTITYKKFIEDNSIKFIDLFSLDVERHEHEVIKGMKGCSVLPSVIVIEGDYTEYREELDELGYVFDIQYLYNAFFIKKDIIELFTFRKLNFIK